MKTTTMARYFELWRKHSPAPWLPWLLLLLQQQQKTLPTCAYRKKRDCCAFASAVVGPQVDEEFEEGRTWCLKIVRTAR